MSDTAATVHGLYNWWMGGRQHGAADRDLGRAVEEKFPAVPVHVRAAQDFHLRVARQCAQQGISRFIHAGPVTLLPMGRNVHDAARQVNPAAQVIYVNWDPDAHAWARQVLSGGRLTQAVLAVPGDMAPAPAVAEMLAGGEPVCVISGLAVHFIDGAVAAKATAGIAAALPPGSVAALSFAAPDGSPQSLELRKMFTPAHVYRHTPEDAEQWLDAAGMKVIPPGVRDVRDLLPRLLKAAGGAAARPPGFIAGGLAVKP